MTDPFLTPTRRRTIAWFVAAAASPMALAAGPARAAPADWPALGPTRSAGPGYGTDPDLAAKTVTWPLSLGPDERAVIDLCADMILPPPSGGKAPSALGIAAFVDEWVSAPYDRQVADRALIVPGLAWLNAEAQRTSRQPFTRATDAQRHAILDAIAWRDRIAPAHARAGAFFASLRTLVMLGYYTTPEGEQDLGFVGNTPIEGVYPGPDGEPLRHLEGQLARLGLSMPTF